MTITIELKPRTEMRLAEKARKEGKPIEAYLEDFIEEIVEKESEHDAMKKSETNQEWLNKFRQWLDGHEDRGGPFLSDEALRRENIYEDRI